MAQKTTTCRDGCVDGEITFYFADFSEKRLREAYVRCAICRPSIKSPGDELNSAPLPGEEKITLELYYEYLAQGWRESDPV